MSSNSQSDIKPTLGEQINDLFGRVAKLNDQMAAVLAPEWGAQMGLIAEGHPLHPGPGPEKTDTAQLAERIRAEVESEVYEYRERTMFWPETGGVTEEIARLATRGALKALDEAAPAATQATEAQNLREQNDPAARADQLAADLLGWRNLAGQHQKATIAAHERADQLAATLERVRNIPRLPHHSEQAGELGRAYTRGWESVISALDAALDRTPEQP